LVLFLRLESPVPFFDLALSIVFGDPISLLDSPHQLIALSGNDIEIVVCQLAPTRFRRTFYLFPFALYLVPIHEFLLKFTTEWKRSSDMTKEQYSESSNIREQAGKNQGSRNRKNSGCRTVL